MTHNSPDQTADKSFLIPLSVLFCTLNTVCYFAASNDFIFLSTLLSKRVFIFPMTLAIGILLFQLYGQAITNRIIAFAITCHLLACLVTQVVFEQPTFLPTSFWQLGLISAGSLFLVQRINLSLFSQQQFTSPLSQALLAMFTALLVDSVLGLFLVTLSLSAFIYTLGISILVGVLSSSVALQLTHYMQTTSQSVQHDPVYSLKVIVAAETTIEKHIANVGFLTERD